MQKCDSLDFWHQSSTCITAQILCSKFWKHRGSDGIFQERGSVTQRVSYITHTHLFFFSDLISSLFQCQTGPLATLLQQLRETYRSSFLSFSLIPPFTSPIPTFSFFPISSPPFSNATQFSNYVHMDTQFSSTIQVFSFQW